MVQSRNNISTVILFIFFILSFSAIKYLPGMLIIQDIFTGIVLLFLVLFYPYLLLTKRYTVSKFEIYGLFIICLEPSISAYMAQEVFGQPYWYGFLAQREIILIACAYIFIYLHRQRASILEDAERALLWVAWFSLIASTLANLLVDNSQLTEQAGFSTGGSDRDNAKIILENAFIIFGFYYYAFMGIGIQFRQSGSKYYSLLFLGYLVFFHGGRAALLAVTMSYLFFYLGRKSISDRIIFFIKLFAAAIVFGIFLYVFPLESIDQLEGKFEDAISVVLTGQESNDYSANARLLEIQIAAPYVENNLLFGNGFISNQWHEGFKEVIGYFHPSDIGLLGVIFEFGMFGLILFTGQIYFLLKYSRQLPFDFGRFGKLSNAIKGFMLYLVLNSVTTGRYVFFVEQSFLCIAILFCISLTQAKGQKC